MLLKVSLFVILLMIGGFKAVQAQSSLQAVSIYTVIGGNWYPSEKGGDYIYISGRFSEGVNPYAWIVNTDSFRADVMIMGNFHDNASWYKDKIVFLDFTNESYVIEWKDDFKTDFREYESKNAHEWLTELYQRLMWEYKNVGSRVMGITIPITARVKILDMNDNSVEWWDGEDLHFAWKLLVKTSIYLEIPQDYKLLQEIYKRH